MSTVTRPGYAIAYLNDVDVNDEIVEYLRRIGPTLEPFEGRFLVHGGELTVAEGTMTGDVVIIAFPSHQAARDWYESDAYREILPLRTRNSIGLVALVEGVTEDYESADKVAELGAA